MPLRCRHCRSANLRNSRFRGSDIFRLMILQRAVRCRDCFERDYAFIFELFKLKTDERERGDHPRVG
jgi:hypothetical protein